MTKTLLLVLPALQEVLSADFRQIKYSLFPPLSLLTLAGLTPEDRFRVIVRDDHVESAMVDEQVDLVGMTVYVSSAYRAYELADIYRRRGAKIVLGGIHPTTLPDEAAKHADAVCMGPAESVWGDLLRDFEQGRLRKLYRGVSQGSAPRVPVARRDLMNPSAYLVPHTLVTSRGCPHACDFCYKSSFWGERYYEPRPVEDIERELATFGSRFAFFLDDNFLADRARVRAIFDVLRGTGTVWQAAASLDAAQAPGYLAEAYAAGCRSLFVGFESLAADNMWGAHKPVNATTDYAEAVRRFHDAGIMINGSFVFGFDGDRPDVFDRTTEFAIENRIETATFHILTPFPGTRFFAEVDAQERLLHRDWRLYDTRHAVFRPAHLSPGALEEGYWRAYDEFYSYGSILRRATGLPSALKRIAYNVGWKKMDGLWAALIHLGLLPQIRPLFEQILAASAPANPKSLGTTPGVECALPRPATTIGGARA